MKFESIEIYLSNASQEVAIRIHDAILNNGWFGLFNSRRRLFFDIKNQVIYQITDSRKHTSEMELKIMKCDDRETFFTMIKLSLITCKQLMDVTQCLTTTFHIKTLLAKPIPDGKEVRKQITGRTPEKRQGDKGSIPG